MKATGLANLITLYREWEKERNQEETTEAESGE